MSLPKTEGEGSIDEIKEAMVQKHLPLIDQAGQQGKMVVLHQDKRFFLALDLFQYCFCIDLIHAQVMFPINFTEHRSGVRNMTEGP